MKNFFCTIWIVLLALNGVGQVATSSDELSLLFIGDIMGHDTQLISAHDSIQGTYDFTEVFEPVKPIIEKADFAIANLEVTLGGAPYKGYPCFSSPDELAVACKESGIDVMVTANNHSCDRRDAGIKRTLRVLDSLNFKRTGTFKNTADWEKNNLLILDKNNIKIGLLNYTYGTNGIKTADKRMVNRINWTQIKLDVEASKKQQLDKLIVFIHWGKEYQTQPNEGQKQLAKYLKSLGVDIIIGSHPHVLQPFEYSPANDSVAESLVVYSLGNFVSNQRSRRKDGGMMFEIKLRKEGDKTTIAAHKCHLTWVNRYRRDKKFAFEILPCEEYINNGFKGLDQSQQYRIKRFINDSKSLLKLK